MSRIGKTPAQFRGDQHLSVNNQLRDELIVGRRLFLAMHNRSKQPERRRFGYTLIEIMLVLSVLVATMAIVWPPLNRMYRDYTLDEAVSNVQTCLGQARYYALDESITYQFRYEPDGENYLVIPYEMELAGDDDSSAGTQFKYANKLKEGMAFKLPQDASKESESIDAEFLAGLPNSHDLESVAWSRPILFYADGTAEDSKFVVEDSQQQSIQFVLRGLTGSVSIGPLSKEGTE